MRVVARDPSNTPVARTAVEAVALEEARRAITSQEQALAELRGRANMLIGAASVIVSFLGAQALRLSGWSTLALLALLAFVATLALATSILWPAKRAWRFRVDARILLEDFADTDPPPRISVQRHLAETLSSAADDNSQQLNSMYQRLRLALAGVAIQAVLWSVHLAQHA